MIFASYRSRRTERLLDVLPYLALDNVCDRRRRDSILAGKVSVPFSCCRALTNGTDAGFRQLTDAVCLASRRQLGVLAERMVWTAKYALRMQAPTVSFASSNPLRLRLRAVTRSRSTSPLAEAVPDVVSLCPQEQVIRPDAGGIVSVGAVVEDTQSVRDQALVDQPGEAMGVLVPALGVQLPVAGGRPRACPEPAAVRLLDLLPEPLLPRSLAVLFGTISRAALTCSSLHLLGTGIERDAAVSSEAGLVTAQKVLVHRKASLSGATPGAVAAAARLLSCSTGRRLFPTAEAA